MEEIYYFSALAEHCIPNDPDVVIRHQKLLSCLKSEGVIIELAKFKEKDVYCQRCRSYTKHHEEKETDVALSIKLLELLINKKCDTIIIMSGDTDIAPAVRTAKKLFPFNGIHFIFPYNRKNKELKTLCPKSIKVSKENYLNHQFPNPFILSDGTEIWKPSTW
jgi:NAD kinase